MAFTVVSFHAHPDDEVLVTGGTLARLASEGHRVVLVTATDGAAGLTSPEIQRLGPLGEVRVAELHRSAAALGVHRVVVLGYPDGGFGAVPVGEAAAQLAAVLTEEDADVLTTYDPAGGYGHPDHVAVHHVGHEAARLAGTPVVLEATVDRRLLLVAVRLLRLAPRLLRVDTVAFEAAYTAPEEITHQVDVSGHLAAKRAALAAHRSQAVGGGRRTVALLLALPPFLTRRVLGREWFVERGRTPTSRRLDDVLASLRE